MKPVIKTKKEVINDLINYWKQEIKKNPKLLEEIIYSGNIKIENSENSDHMLGYDDYEDYELLEVCIDLNLYPDIFQTNEFKHEMEWGDSWEDVEKYLKIIN